MLKLPFQVESPLPTAIIVGVVAIVFAVLWWLFDKNTRLRNILLNYFLRRLRVFGPERSEAAAKMLLLGMAVLLSLGSAFGFCVASGIIQNGEGAKKEVTEESKALREFLEKSNGRIDVKELVRQDKARKNQSDGPDSR
jgi:hypothetical protein